MLILRRSFINSIEYSKVASILAAFLFTFRTMLCKTINFVIAFILLNTPALATPDIVPERFFWARVVLVSDGDTIVAVQRNDDLDMIKIRLYGLDAPEGGQAYGKKATRELRRMINKKLVLIEIVRKSDRYGRIVGIVKLEGVDVGKKMAASGLAWVEPKYCKRKNPCNAYWASVKKAQKDKIGLWKEKAVPPWEWR